MPWDELRRHPELQALCDANGTRPCGYVDGNLTAEVHDLRAPEHAVLGLESRVMTLHACDDDLTQDLAELECDAVLHQGSAPWSDAFKQRLEAMLLLATAPPLCLRPTDSTAAVGRLTNAMQYNRLKFNCAELRCAALEAPPLPVRAPRYTWLGLGLGITLVSLP